jgi:prepilin-type N-terminal cleavage/methylation domain-containing protein
VTEAVSAGAGMHGRAAPVARRAFTLIELLVVIGIFLLLMGLSVASVVRAPKVNRMLAAEQVVADCIRQARHTARTSGQPVILKLRKDTRAVSGLLRQVLWQGMEDWPQVDDGSGTQVDAPGRTGSGLWLPMAYKVGGLDSGAVDSASGASSRLLLPAMTGQPLNGGNRLWRGVATPTSRPGLLLSAWVRPPTAGNAGVPDLIPVVLVGADAAPSDGTFAAHGTSLMGIALVQSDTGGGIGASRTTVAKSWEVIGWFGAPDDATCVEVSSTATSDVIKDMTLVSGHRNTVRVIDSSDAGVVVEGAAEAGPLTGGRWTELSLLVDGPRIVLYRDGRRIAEKSGVDSVSLAEPADERVYVGCINVGSGLAVAQGTEIDDVRLERLGDAMAGNLPAGVKVDADRRITCHPDGRVEINANDSSASTPTDIPLTSESGESATLTITTAGSVTTTLVVP